MLLRLQTYLRRTPDQHVESASQSNISEMQHHTVITPPVSCTAVRPLVCLVCHLQDDTLYPTGQGILYFDNLFAFVLPTSRLYNFEFSHLMPVGQSLDIMSLLSLEALDLGVCIH